LNGIVVEAFTKAKKVPESLKDVAAIYNNIFAMAEKGGSAPAGEGADEGKKVVEASGATAPSPTAEATTTVAPSAQLEAIRDLLYGVDAPANLTYEATAVMIKRQIDDKTSGLRREVEALNWTEPGAPLRAMALADKAKPANSRVFLRGNPANKGPEVPRQFLEVLAGEKRTPFASGSGRLELAREIASPRNPLTARVFVNRVWGWHFGPALVRTPSDFGVRTEAPLHRALLDWLTAGFVEAGWSVKQLHRSILLSATYQQSSDEHPAAAAVDPDNQLIHRFNRRRLDFEALRDTLLAVSGALDPKAGGLPDDLTKEPFTTRRTVYGFIDRQNLPAMFRTFDFPNPDVSSAGRFATTVPQQALFMMNSPFAQEQARQVWRRADLKAAGAETGRIRALYRVLYQRFPDADELRLAQEFMQRPEVAPAPRPAFAAGWQYGRGTFDPGLDRIRDFQAWTARRDGRMSPGDKFPDPMLGHLSLTAAGGHPGATADAACVRRWTAPAKGIVRIEGALGHANTAGDGVRGRIVSSLRGTLGGWTVHNQKLDTKLDAAGVEAGECIDFVVDAIANANSDSFTWAPTITFTAEGDAPSRTWNARKDFDAPPKAALPLTRWEELAQVLLLSNELAFVD
jgi:hypothetical protein